MSRPCAFHFSMLSLRSPRSQFGHSTGGRTTTAGETERTALARRRGRNERLRLRFAFSSRNRGIRFGAKPLLRRARLNSRETVNQHTDEFGLVSRSWRLPAGGATQRKRLHLGESHPRQQQAATHITQGAEFLSTRMRAATVSESRARWRPFEWSPGSILSSGRDART